MNFKIKRIIKSKTNDLSNLIGLIGTEFHLKDSAELIGEVLEVEEESEYPILITIKEPIKFVEKTVTDEYGETTIERQPVEFLDGGMDYFNLLGKSMSGSYELDELSRMRLLGFLITTEDKEEEISIEDEDESTIGIKFKEVLEKYGYSVGGENSFFVAISDAVANASVVPEEDLREDYKLRVDWIYRLREITDDGDIYTKERVLGIINYVNNCDESILKRNAFIAPYDKDMIAVNCDQVESVRPATDEEIRLWEKSLLKEQDVFPLLIDGNNELIPDPVLEQKRSTEETTTD